MGSVVHLTAAFVDFVAELRRTAGLPKSRCRAPISGNQELVVLAEWITDWEVVTLSWDHVRREAAWPWFRQFLDASSFAHLGRFIKDVENYKKVSASAIPVMFCKR